MIWEDLTIESLKDYLQNKTGYAVSTSKSGYPYEIKLSKDVFIYIDLSEDGDLSLWKSNLLVHLDLQQCKGVFRGCGLAVDNFESLDSEIQKLIAQGLLWIKEKEEVK